MRRTIVLRRIAKKGDLTRRQMSVLRRLAKGMRPKAIAADLHLQVGHVRNLIFAIRTRLGVDSVNALHALMLREMGKR